MKPLLDISNLTINFNGPLGEVTAVRNVSIQVHAGETLALVGESGCGKTALCRSILKLHSEHAVIDADRIDLCGHNIAKLDDRSMDNIRGSLVSMVFQDPMSSLNPTYSVGSQISEAILLHNDCTKREAADRAVRLLRSVGIDNPEARYKQYPYHLSGGMRQRVAIAIAMACKPRILIADEPTTALDASTQTKIIELLRDIKDRSDMGMIFVTHDLGIAEEIADRIVVMQNGSIVEEGPVEEIFACPKHPYTKKLLGYADYGKGKGHVHGAMHYHNGIPHSHETESKPVLVQVRDLCKSFELGSGKRIAAVNHMSLDIRRGEILGIVGDSGCGKSTLARCIMGIYKPDSGDINFAGECRKQMIFQDSVSAFNSRMTLKQIIAEPIVIDRGWRKRMKHADIDERVAEVMKLVHLEPELINRHPYDVSGGQRQRAAIARALITDPEFLIADEPISSLDVSIQAQIIHLLKDIREQRDLTILLIAHDLPMVAHVSDRIVDLNINAKNSGM